MVEIDTPWKRALAMQWLLEKKMTMLREKMPPEAFEELARAVDVLLEPWEWIAKRD